MSRRSQITDVLSLVALACLGCGGAPLPETSDVDFAQQAASRTRSRPGPAAVPGAASPPVKLVAASAATEPTPSSEGPKAPPQAQPEESKPPSPSPAEQPAARPPAASEGRGAGRRGAPASPLPSEPTLPGRQASDRPATPAAAAAAGRRQLQAAAAAAGRGDRTTACRLALEACSIVAAHAAADADCRQIAAEAERIVTRAGSRPARAVGPTRFE